MATVFEQPVGSFRRGSAQLAGRAIWRCLREIGPIDRLLAIVDGASRFQEWFNRAALAPN